MADSRALTIQGGIRQQIANADALIVGDGILTPSGSGNSLTLTPDGSNVVVASGKTLEFATADRTGTIDIGVVSATTITIGRAGEQVTIGGDLSISGTTTAVGGTTFESSATFEGNVVFGNMVTDTVQYGASDGTGARVGPVASPNMHWVAEVNHAVDVDQSSTISTVGGTLSYSAGQGSDASGATAGAAGGAISIVGGAGGDAGAGAGAAAVGAAASVTGGAGGAGTATGVAGAGSDVTITGGAAGSDGGAGGATGGSITINAGALSGAGTDGSINIGAADTADVTIGNATDNPFFDFLGTGDIRLGSQIRFTERSGDPSSVANTGFVYTKDVSGTTELFYEDSAGTVTQVTAGGGSSTDILIADNTTNAFRVRESTNEYNNINTTNGSEEMSWGNATTNPEFTFLGSGNVTITANQDFVAEADHTITVPASTTISTVGGALDIVSAAGSPASGATAGATGGAASLTAGTGGAAAAGAGSAGAGATVTVAAGTGGAGTATGVAATGGQVTITGGSGGADGGAGGALAGDVVLNAGAGTGGSVNGDILVGTTTAARVLLGNTSVTDSGFNFADNTASVFRLRQGSDEYFNIDTTNASEAVDFGNATTNPEFTFLGSGDVTITADLDFVAEASHTVTVPASTTISTVGGALDITSGAGSPASGATAGATGGAASLTAGTGGAAGAGAGSAGAGAIVTVAAGTGGAGTATGVGSTGGQVTITGGSGGADGGAGGALAGDVVLNAGAGTGGNVNGDIFVGTTTAARILVGNTSVTDSGFNFADNTASVFRLRQGSDEYFNIDTTNGSETVDLGNATTNPVVNILGTSDFRLGSQIRFTERSGDPSSVANTGFVYTKDVSTVTELFYEDSAGSVTQLTASGGSVKPSVTVTAGESLAAGAPVSMANVAGSPRAFEGDANGTGNRPKVIGFTAAVIASAASGTVQVASDVAVPDANWDSVPVVANVGDAVYLSETVGNVTLTAPSTSGSTVVQLGIVTVGGAGAVEIAINIGDPTVLA